MKRGLFRVGVVLCVALMGGGLALLPARRDRPNRTRPPETVIALERRLSPGHLLEHRSSGLKAKPHRIGQRAASVRTSCCAGKGGDDA